MVNLKLVTLRVIAWEGYCPDFAKIDKWVLPAEAGITSVHKK